MHEDPDARRDEETRTRECSFFFFRENVFIRNEKSREKPRSERKKEKKKNRTGATPQKKFASFRETG